MSLEHEEVNSYHHLEMATDQGTKRAASPLFVSDSEHTEPTSEQGTKRRKKDLASDEDDINKPASLKIDEDGFVLPHDPTTAERRLSLAIYHESFKSAERIVYEVCSDFIAVVAKLRAEGFEIETITRICNDKLVKFLNLAHIYPSVGPICMLGNAGIGKSSFISNILGQKGLAPESDGMKRGTSVPHEYSMALAKQTALFEVDAMFWRQSQIKTKVAEHCLNIFGLLSQTQDPEAEEEEVDGEELQARYETAIEFFHTLLCDRAQFESIASTQKYFEAHKLHDEERLVGDLVALIENFKTTRGLEDCREIHTAETSGELADIFRRVSKAPKPIPGRIPSPHPWPIIPQVQIRYEHELLKSGIRLGDTPGTNDSNQSVVSATTNYLNQAEAVLIFETIKRSDDTRELDANLRECMRQGKTHNMSLVLTMIDIKERYSPDERYDLSQDDRDMLEAAENLVAKLKFQQKALKQAKANADGEELKKLDKAYDEMPIKIAMADARIDQVSIEIRSREALNALRGKIRKLMGSNNAPDLPVFPISNKEYSKHQAGYDATKPPLLDIEGTGIPAVRRMLWEIPARGKRNTLQRICRTRLPNIFNGITGILTKSPLARKTDVERVIRAILGQYVFLLDGIERDLKELFRRNVTAIIDTNEASWQEKAGCLIDQWQTYKAMTFFAFCRRSGHWGTKKGTKKWENFISWNKKIQDIIADKMGTAFDRLDDEITGMKLNTVDNLSKLFSKLEMELEECEDFQGNGDAQRFFKIIRATGDGVAKEMSSLFDIFKKNVTEVRHGTIQDNEKSFVAIAMQKTYRKCLELAAVNHQSSEEAPRVYKKSGVHPKRVETIRQKLKGTGEEESVFASVADQAEKAFEQKLTAWKDKCNARLSKCNELIIADFNRRFVVSEVKNEENPEAREILRDATNKALERIEDELKEHVERFEAYEKAGGAMR